VINLEVRRATFEQVQKAQEDLIFSDTGIDKLIELNETINPKSRSVFFERLAMSLLGKELDYPYILKYNGGEYPLGSLALWTRKLAYFTDTNDGCQEIKLNGKKYRVPNRELWIALRESLYKPIAEALTLSMKSSQEVLRGSGDSFGVNLDTKFKNE